MDKPNKNIQLWDEKKKNSVNEVLKFIKSQKINDGDGWVYSIKFDIAMMVLMNSSQNTPLTERTIFKILKKMYERNISDADGFEKIYYEEIKDINYNEINSWDYYLPFEVRISPDIKASLNFKCLGQYFTIVGVKNVYDTLGINVHDARIIHQTTGFIPDDSYKPNYFIKVNGVGNEVGHTWEKKIAPAYDTLRGVMEFTFQPLWQLRHGEYPRRQIPHPRWVLISNNKNKELSGYYFITDEYQSYKIFILDDKNIESLQKQLLPFNNKLNKNSIYYLISVALRLYAQAMDARHSHSCFLGLWQIAELLTFTEDYHGKAEKLISRLLWFEDAMGLEFNIKSVLEDFRDKRNDMVHRGINNISEKEVNVLKVICNTILLWMYSNADEIKTVNHLRKYYELKDKGDNELEAIKDVIGYINKGTDNRIFN